MPEFKEAAETVAVQFKTDAKASRKKKKEKSLAAQGIPMEELQRQQEALFAQAREDYETVLADQGVEEDKEDEPEFTLVRRARPNTRAASNPCVVIGPTITTPIPILIPISIRNAASPPLSRSATPRRRIPVPRPW